MGSFEKISSAALNSPAPAGPTGRIAVTGFDLFFPLAGLVDTDAEKSRLKSEIAKLTEDRGFVEKRLANKNFVDKAKSELVEKERERLREFETKLAALADALRKL